MKISFAITTHNEGDCIDRLLSQLSEFIEVSGHDDEIVILDDFSDDSDTVVILEEYSDKSYVHLHRRHLNRNFGAHKNHLNSLCSGDYIFQIDADEYLSTTLLDNIHYLIEANKVDLILVPRINTVTGLTDEHVREWGWRVDERGWIMFPDYQTRIYRNDPDIMWTGKVHERIEGYETYGQLPAEEPYCIIHHKDISKQEQQNALYSEIIQDNS